MKMANEKRKMKNVDDEYIQDNSNEEDSTLNIPPKKKQKNNCC
jgi:hypothetical protein